MELKSFVTPIIKWWWLVAAAVILAAATSFLVTRNQPPVYTSSTKLVIGQTMTNPNPSNNDFYLNQQLAGLYENIAFTEPVKSGTMKALGLSWLPNYVVKPIGNNQFIEIDVTDTSPERAMRVAQELAKQLILVSPGGSQTINQTRAAFVDSQINDLQAQINQTQSQIAKNQADMAGIQSAQAIDQAQQNQQALQSKLTLLQTNYANLVASTQTSMANSLEIIEPASLPSQPVGPGKLVIIAITSIIGFILSAGGAYLLEFADDSIKKPEDVHKLMNAPIIGYFAEMGKSFKQGMPFVLQYPFSAIAEVYRTLSLSLEFPKSGKPVKTVLISSPDAGDGKTTIAINLALTLIQSGKRILLVDADLRRPSVHSYLNIPAQQPGLSNWLLDKGKIDSYITKWEDTPLQVITAGTVGESLLDQTLTPQRISSLLAVLLNWADIVIIDSSPLFVSTTLLLASRVDGVVLAIRPGHTRKDIVQNMMERLGWAGATLVGVVLNRIPLGQIGYFGNFHSYSPYYSGYMTDKTSKHNGKASVKIAKPMKDAVPEDRR